MGILLAAGQDGLLFFHRTWQRLPCPLPCPDMLARGMHCIAVVDNTQNLLWTGGEVIPVDSGIEQVLFWRDCILTLSGDTDCLTLLDGATGTPITTVPAGVYPQDMCLLPGGSLLAVCGGADGLLRLFSLPDFVIQQQIRLPGNVQRVAWSAGQLYTLCALEDEGLKCLLCRLAPRSPQVKPLAAWPGLPGAIHADASGRVWVAASEMLYAFSPGASAPACMEGDFGLIRHLDSCGQALLVSDPVMDQLSSVTNDEPLTLKVENVHHGLFV